MTEEMLAELTDGLYKIFGASLFEIILYGSYVRREETHDSDVDIAIVIDGTLSHDNREKIIDLASYLDLKYGTVVSIIDLELDMLNEWGQILPFYKNVQEEGIVLWRAPCEDLNLTPFTGF